MSLSLTTSDWMMVTRLIYRINCIESSRDYPAEVLRILNQMVPFSRGIFNFLQEKENTIVAESICGLHFPKQALKELTEQELNENCFLRSLYVHCSTKVYRGPSLAELDKKDLAGTALFPDCVQHTLTMILQHKGELLGYLILLRDNREEAFSRRDSCVLEELYAHISLQLSKLRFQLTEKTENALPIWEQMLQNYDLSKRETEVVYYFYRGFSDEEICQQLFISKSTFKKHVTHIYQKMKLNNRVALFKSVERLLANDPYEANGRRMQSKTVL